MVLKVEHQHQCLSVFELKGFVGCKVDVELVQYILKNAMSLQKIIITLRNYRNLEKKVSAITCARQLETRLPPGVELVML
ncbi:hypothetical protein CFP56_013409 [Quercus suber]|uniref:FBD domain-containing protein n=1 Tax=Quercus suber TaxID=58331 RepID=A0AAW0KW64_QUESU